MVGKTLTSGSPISIYVSAGYVQCVDIWGVHRALTIFCPRSFSLEITCSQLSMSHPPLKVQLYWFSKITRIMLPWWQTFSKSSFFKADFFLNLIKKKNCIIFVYIHIDNCLISLLNRKLKFWLTVRDLCPSTF